MVWEFAVLDWLQTVHTPVLDAFFKTITHLGDKGLFFIVLGVILVCIPRTRSLGAGMLAALVLGALICNVTLKPLIARARPCWINDTVQLLVAAPKDFSFPSGHSFCSFAAATAVFLHHKKWGVAMYVVAVLIAVSRLYLYVHFPTDVLVGAVIGICVGILGVQLVKMWEAARAKKRLHTMQ